MTFRIVAGDCRVVMPDEGPFDMILADPPYGDTSLSWDRRLDGWLGLAHSRCKPSGSMWVFGSMRFLMATATDFRAAGWRYAQDIVWEKHNGSGFAVDRFKRVHEHAVQFYRIDSAWGNVFNDVQTTPDAMAKSFQRKQQPPHAGSIKASTYESHEGGPRIMRSVIPMRSMQGRAIHPTEKPSSLLEVLIRTSCPPGGLVGDFFAGSGAGGEACLMSGRDYLGVEIDPVMAAKAGERLGSSLFAEERRA